MRLLHLSDPHVTPAGKTIFGRDSGQTLARAIDGLLLSSLGHIDAVVVTGDLSARGDAGSYEIVEEALARLGLPVVIDAGNHDDASAVAALQPRLERAIPVETGPLPLDRRLDFGDVQLVGLDTRSECDEEPGRIDHRTVEWLERTVLAEARPTVLHFHQPPVRRVQAVAPLGNAAMLEELVARHPNVRAVLCGHVHRCSVGTWAGTVLVTVNSPNHQIAFADGSGSPAGYVVRTEPGMAALIDLTRGLTVEFVPLADPGMGVEAPGT